MIKTFISQNQLSRLLPYIMVLLLPSTALHARALPIIQHVGVLPIDWQGDITRFERRDLVAALNEAAPKIVREAKRFHIINDEIISDYGMTSEGRQTLSEQFELDAFVSISADWSDDLLVIEAALRSPELENYLIEYERIPQSWLGERGSDAVVTRLRELIFRLFNRYPIDVYVNSLQGRYLTLSAGQNQSLSEGSELDISRFNISSVHPANRTWLAFSKKYLGKVQLVDVKEYSSVAVIKSLAYDNAIQIGDGARIKDISSRALFASSDNEEKSWMSQELERSPIQAPIKIRLIKDPPKLAQATSQDNNPEKAKDNKTAATNDTLESSSPSPKKIDRVEPSEIPITTNEPAEEPDEPWNWFGISALWQSIQEENLKRFDLGLGLKIWSVEKDKSGAGAEDGAKASSNVPLWLVNYLSLAGHFDWGSSDFSNLGLRLHSGPTDKGTAIGVTINASYIKQLSFPGFLLDSNDGIEFGGEFNLGTLSVTEESYGGADSLEAALLAGIHGRYHFIDMAKTVRYRTGIILDVVGIGKAGIPDAFVDIKGKVSYGLYGEGQLLPANDEWIWGGFAKLSVGSYHTSQNPISISEVLLGFNAHLMLP